MQQSARALTEDNELIIVDVDLDIDAATPLRVINAAEGGYILATPLVYVHVTCCHTHTHTHTI